MAAKNKVGVRIAGKDYVLMGIESDEYMQKVGLYIDRKMNEIMRVNSKLSTSMVAVLTSINVADDYFKAHESETALKSELQHAYEEIERLKSENRQLCDENAVFSEKSMNLQLELVKREAELNEVRNSQDKAANNHKIYPNRAKDSAL